MGGLKGLWSSIIHPTMNTMLFDVAYDDEHAWRWDQCWDQLSLWDEWWWWWWWWWCCQSIVIPQCCWTWMTILMAASSMVWPNEQTSAIWNPGVGDVESHRKFFMAISNFLPQLEVSSWYKCHKPQYQLSYFYTNFKLPIISTWYKSAQGWTLPLSGQPMAGDFQLVMVPPIARWFHGQFRTQMDDEQGNLPMTLVSPSHFSSGDLEGLLVFGSEEAPAFRQK